MVSVVAAPEAHQHHCCSQAADEYSSSVQDRRLGLQQLNDLECPACSGGNCAYHVDGNMKVFVWDHGREPHRLPHSDVFLAGDDDVQRTIQAIDCARVCAFSSPCETSPVCSYVPSAWCACAQVSRNSTVTLGKIASVHDLYGIDAWSSLFFLLLCLSIRAMTGQALQTQRRGRTGLATGCGQLLGMGSSGVRQSKQ